MMKVSFGKGLISCILAVAALLSLMSLTSCKKYTNEEMGAIIEEMLPTSKYVMWAVYGDFLEVEEPEKIDKTWTTPHYFKVKKDSYYTTIAAIKADAEKVFTPQYLEAVYAYAFEGSDEAMSRFAENEGRLTLDVVKEAQNVMTDIYPETVEIISQSRFSCKLSVEASADGGKTRRSIKLSLSCIDGVWLFNGPTY